MAWLIFVIVFVPAFEGSFKYTSQKVDLLSNEWIFHLVEIANDK